MFQEHAILKGGVALRLYDCPRATNDIDYLFVPFRSKKDVSERIRTVLAELPDAEVRVATHSKMIRVTVVVDGAAIQVEANVAMSCPSTAMPTGALALAQHQPSQIIRVMSLGAALANKLAAWNERRLLRDLYDCYFMSVRLGARLDESILRTRLERIESRLPQLARRRRMTPHDLADDLMVAADAIDEVAIRDELGPMLPHAERQGLEPRLRAALVQLAERLRDLDTEP